jgi:hypothetical protein
MVRLTKPGGVIYVCAPSNGGVHRYPVDVYRFYPDSANALVNFAEREGVQVGLEETFIYRGVDGGWSDWVAVFRKGKASKRQKERVGDYFDSFYFEDVTVTDSRQAFTVPDQDLIAHLRARLTMSEAEKKEILSSRAWRFTKPLRTITGALRRLRS